MPRILLYEFLTGGGLLSGPDAPHAASLRREGGAMLAAIAADFSAIDGVSTTIILDSLDDTGSLPSDVCRIVKVREPGGDCAALAEHCRNADWTIVIAPEFDGLLESRLKIVEISGGRLLGPSSRLAALATDKQRTAEHLAKAGVHAAHGLAIRPDELLDAAEQIGIPVVVKPIDGAGSQDVRLLTNQVAVTEFQRQAMASGNRANKLRLERFYPGMAASAAVLCGPGGLFPLAPFSQRLSDDGQFYYLGGICPLAPAFADRATRLAFSAVRSLGDTLGYIGVDMVLGNDPTGAGDVVVEINPRLTTSYVGLRAAAQSNLAAAMLAVAEGRTAELRFGDAAVEFDSDGTIRRAESIVMRPQPAPHAARGVPGVSPPAESNRR